MDNSKLYKDPDKLGILVTKPSCYDFQLGQDKSIGRGTYFFFGGPARDLHELLMFFSVCCIHPGLLLVIVEEMMTCHVILCVIHY
ncbi:hypothetical protein G4B88_019684 [Cannabis sativa]|uniref:Uncharacterized protein n=1 Tax=Cannabis sativa TaxID=3483 RepID=A0A7J6HRQ8_CANSA|nr:hypothetical protein G4B88_019684 [Cannabis sativa]